MSRRGRLRQPSFRFRPYSRKQKQLLTWWMDRNPMSDRDMLIADGSIRSGKTVAMIDGFTTWTMAEFRGENFIVAGRTMGALRRNVIGPMLQILRAKGIPYHYNRSENWIDVGGNTYHLFGASNEAAQDVVQGLTAAGAYADDGGLFPKSFTDQMVGRCSVDGSRIWVNANPQGPFHYLKTDYIDRSDEKGIMRLQFQLDDNLTLSERVKERYRRMFSGVFYQRNILGLWVVAEGIVYDMWDEKKHVVSQSELPESFARYHVGVDYGTSNPTVFLLIGEHKGSLYVLREYYHDGRKQGQKSPAQHSADFRQWIDGTLYRTIVPDPAASAFIAQLREDGVSRIRLADNAVVPGIQDVASRLTNGTLFVCREGCPNLIQEFSSYAWDAKAQQRGEDKPTKEHDHALDALRYVVHTIYPTRGHLRPVRKPRHF